MHEQYHNGSFSPIAGRRSPLDCGLLDGDAVFEVIPAYGARPLRLAAHLARLEANLGQLGLSAPLRADEWRALFDRLLGDAPGVDQVLYVQIGVPVAAPGAPGGPASVLALAAPMRPRDPVVAEFGVAAVTRPDPGPCGEPGLALLADLLLREEADAADAEEALLVRDGCLLRGANSSLFLADADTLVTPPRDARLRPGVIRDLVLEVAAGAGIACVERPVPLAEARAATELMLASCRREIVPVTRLDGARIGDGAPGPLWRRLDALYQDCKAELRGYHV